MQLRDYWQVLRRRWWLIALVAAVATASSLAYSLSQEHIYRATAKLLVSPARTDYGQTLVIERILRQYSEQIQTDRLARSVDQRLALDLATDKLRGQLRVSPVNEDMLIRLEVDDRDAMRARDIAFTWSDEFVKLHQERMATIKPEDRIEVALLDTPRPGELNFPKTRQLALAALVLGLVVGLLLCFGLEYLDDSIKTTEDVERHLALPVLAAIPRAAAAVPVTRKAAAGR